MRICIRRRRVALSFVLLTVARLCMRSFVAIGRGPGLHPGGLLAMNMTLSVPKLVSAGRYAAFYEGLVEELS